ncbi:hypothetical protein IMG5_056350 [Ichthyophthirius multifiliis]|uniref:Guanylate cyclase domain-containing protein n=1 Tax=Ichthyophthirius multifiliis TaxID=5932 RepID=G0QN91_ICHMU|nr:hypothetical protein IMG5_056350 [Ichthyophthirius multifiliis]EGR33312.1 hypothetical protein IMG5_056350 [Ichthyophthirius multifiliis]|eukprot:XP_004037298.1 hypothetical protein IMG5_056350 [Ichthyophthirius multifiliis]
MKKVQSQLKIEQIDEINIKEEDSHKKDKKNVKKINKVKINQKSILQQKFQEFRVNYNQIKQKIIYKQKKKTIRLVENNFFETITTISTFFALYGDNIRIVSSDKYHDYIFYNLSFTCFIIFLIELIINSIAKKFYLLSFSFWMDCISTISLIFDIPWFSQFIFDISFDNNQVNFLKAGRVSRVTTRASRLVRFIRLIRLVKLGRLYKHAFQAIGNRVNKQIQIENEQQEEDKQQNENLDQQDFNQNSQMENDNIDKNNSNNNENDIDNNNNNNNNKNNNNNNNNNNNYNNNNTNQQYINLFKDQSNQNITESKVGKKLSDLTTKRVILLIFSIVLSIPLFSVETYVQIDTSFNTGLNFLQQIENQSINYSNQKYFYSLFQKNYLDKNKNLDRYKIIFLQIRGIKIYQDQLNNELREVEKSYYRLNDHDPNIESYSIVSLKDDQDLSAILEIVRTTYLIIILACASIYFTKDSNEMVVDPIERMLAKVQLISENPLEAARIAEDEAIAEQELVKNLNPQELQLLQKQKTYETSILESTIIKFGALLAIGFGEAGSEIIGQNMSGDGNVNPMIPGRKIMAIFGFVAIHNFSDVTQVLQEKIMIFANEIAEIVHNVCDSFHGQTNKNLGDCFLVVWKFKKNEKLVYLNKNEELCINKQAFSQNYTDLSIVGFLKIIACTHKLSQTQRFQGHLQLIKQQYPNFSLKLGFGLHLGWGIEGSIGSDFKIDASYLSPNVNLASRLECATKQYGLYILLSGAVYRLLSDKCQSYLRHIDRVTVKGSDQPMDLYTCDVDPNQLQLKIYNLKKQLEQNDKNKKILRFIQRQKKDERYIKIIKNNIQINKMFEIDNDIMVMRQKFSPQFFNAFHEGLQQYLDGYWDQANIYFQKANVYNFIYKIKFFINIFLVYIIINQS